MRIRHSIRNSQNVREQWQSFVECMRLFDNFEQWFARNELHGIKWFARWPSPSFVYRDNRRMLKASRHQRFSHKSIFVCPTFFEQNFNRNASVESFVASGKYSSNPSLRDFPFDMVDSFFDDGQTRNVWSPRSRRSRHERQSYVVWTNGRLKRDIHGPLAFACGLLRR
jgi:hypothetical protein